MRGRQNSSDHARRSDRRAGADDAERARAAFKQRWEETTAAYRHAYFEPSSSTEEKHAREIAYALAVWRLEQASQRLRGSKAPHGAPSKDAKEVIGGERR